jgi:hypothetical protein
MIVYDRLNRLDIPLATPAKPAAAYKTCAELGGPVYVSAQLPFADHGSTILGFLRADLGQEADAEVAGLCAIMIGAHLHDHLDRDLGRLPALSSSASSSSPHLISLGRQKSPTVPLNYCAPFLARPASMLAQMSA